MMPGGIVEAMAVCGLDANFLPYFSWISSRKHVKVKGDISPFDPGSVISVT